MYTPVVVTHTKEFTLESLLGGVLATRSSRITFILRIYPKTDEFDGNMEFHRRPKPSNKDTPSSVDFSSDNDLQPCALKATFLHI